ncbi:MAG: transposase, partial [Phycisphaerales bacterium]|nr:transposase [Phycisphaerales bacterium]
MWRAIEPSIGATLATSRQRGTGAVRAPCQRRCKRRVGARSLTIPAVARKLGIIDQTYDRWRREYGGMKVDQTRRLKELE